MARNTPLAPMIGPDAVAHAQRHADPVPKTAELVAGTLRRMVVDGQLNDGDFLPNEAELMAHFGVSRPDAARSGPGAGIRTARRGAPRFPHRRPRAGARPGDRRAARRACCSNCPGATIADVLVARSGIEPMAVRLLAESGIAEAFDELETMLAERHPGGLAVGSAGRDHRRVSPPHGGALGQRHADDHRGHAARDHGAAHGFRVQGAPAGVEGRLRQADAVLPAADARCCARATAPAPRRTGASTSTPRATCC